MPAPSRRAAHLNKGEGSALALPAKWPISPSPREMVSIRRQKRARDYLRLQPQNRRQASIECVGFRIGERTGYLNDDISRWVSISEETAVDAENRRDVPSRQGRSRARRPASGIADSLPRPDRVTRVRASFVAARAEAMLRRRCAWLFGEGNYGSLRSTASSRNAIIPTFHIPNTRIPTLMRFSANRSSAP